MKNNSIQCKTRSGRVTTRISLVATDNKKKDIEEIKDDKEKKLDNKKEYIDSQEKTNMENRKNTGKNRVEEDESNKTKETQIGNRKRGRKKVASKNNVAEKLAVVETIAISDKSTKNSRFKDKDLGTSRAAKEDKTPIVNGANTSKTWTRSKGDNFEQSQGKETSASSNKSRNKRINIDEVEKTAARKTKDRHELNDSKINSKQSTSSNETIKDTSISILEVKLTKLPQKIIKARSSLSLKDYDFLYPEKHNSFHKTLEDSSDLILHDTTTKSLRNLPARRASTRRQSILNFEDASTSTPRRITNINKDNLGKSSNNLEISTINNINQDKHNSTFLKPSEVPRKKKPTSKVNEEVINNKEELNKSKTNTPAIKSAIYKPKVKQNVKLKMPPEKESTPIKSIKSLRPRKPNKIYKDFENSDSIRIDDEDDDNEIETKAEPANVPVYKKFLNLPEHKKKKKDVYDFDFDTASGSQSDSDNEYDKEMLGEMQVIKKMEKQHIRITKKKAMAVKRLKNKKEENKKTNEQEIMKKQMNNKNNGGNNNIQKQVVINNQKNGKLTSTTVQCNKEKTKRKVSILQDMEFHMNEDLFTNLPIVDDQHAQNQSPLKNNKKSSVNEILEIQNSFLELDNPPMSSPYRTPNNNTTDKRKSMAYESFCNPINNYANSTINQLTSSPWRPHLTYRNGPHILQTKKSSLPAFNQDMVLNATIVEAHESSKHKQKQNTQEEASITTEKDSKKVKEKDVPAPLRTSKRIQMKQTSILSYLPGNNTSQEVDMNYTLFDENLLMSPVKESRNLDKSPVRIPRSFKDINDKRILRDKTNLINGLITTPQRDISPSDVDFFASTATVEIAPTGKPTRFLVVSPKKKKGNQDVEIDHVEDEKLETESRIGNESQDETNTEADCNKNIVGLFEDFNDLQTTREGMPSFTYERKRKRVRINSYVSDKEDSGGEWSPDTTKKKHRKKKVDMPKKEMEEMNKWAKEFNKMCEEVDEYTLNVE